MSESVPAKRYPVLIAGAGPVGLALAIELAWRGIYCLVVEQSDGSVDFPTTNLARRIVRKGGCGYQSRILIQSCTLTRIR
jgi:cation diffusion facilitator CzcD-associated flavoprotein CzcO